MPHPVYTRFELHELPLVELKKIAIEIGAKPADKRSKVSVAQAILDTQAIEVAPKMPELCINTCGVRNLHELKEWCQVRDIDQTDDFGTLYRSILNYLVGFPSSHLGGGDCIDRAMQDNARLAEDICSELGVHLMDLSLEYGDVVIPHGQDAYWVMMGANKIAALSTWGSGYVSSQSKLGGCDDPYTATLEVLEWMIGAGEIEIARAAVERDRELKALMPEYM